MNKAESKWRYSFYLWPEIRKDTPMAIFQLFKMLNSRIELEMTALEFVRFRLDVGMFGITLREITREPYVEPEIVL